jgi:hypothetical protein
VQRIDARRETKPPAGRYGLRAGADIPLRPPRSLAPMPAFGGMSTSRRSPAYDPHRPGFFFSRFILRKAEAAKMSQK